MKLPPKSSFPGFLLLYMAPQLPLPLLFPYSKPTTPPHNCAAICCLIYFHLALSDLVHYAFTLFSHFPLCPPLSPFLCISSCSSFVHLYLCLHLLFLFSPLPVTWILQVKKWESPEVTRAPPQVSISDYRFHSFPSSIIFLIPVTSNHK